ncbi:hypothetical protein MMC17_009222 [Xylographa soralifera]|nr:hypothetical protein [Xylographa soralifera]
MNSGYSRLLQLSSKNLRTRGSQLRPRLVSPVLAYTSKRPASNKMNTEPPKHKMVYFPNMVNALPSGSGEFRRLEETLARRFDFTVLLNGDFAGVKVLQVHTVDQALTFTSGKAKATVGGEEKDVEAGDLVVVPAGTQHQFVNTGPTPLILYTIYSPAEHNPTTVHKTKEEGDELEESGKDEAPEWSQKSKKENKDAGLV